MGRSVGNGVGEGTQDSTFELDRRVVGFGCMEEMTVGEAAPIYFCVRLLGGWRPLRGSRSNPATRDVWTGFFLFLFSCLL